MSGNLPGAAAMTPRQAYEAWRAAIPDVVCNVPGGAWEDLPVTVQAGFAAIATRQPRTAPGDASGLLEPLHALAAKWDATAARNQRNGQSLVDQGDEYGNEGLAVAEALGACVVDLRAVLADAPEPQPAPELAAQPPSPEPDGTIVIGPQCFASADKRVISWHGINYYPWASDPDHQVLPAPELATLRELLDEIGVMAANAPEDGDSFAVLEEIAMRIAAHGVPDTTPIDEWPDPENPVTGRTPGSAAPELAAAFPAAKAALARVLSWFPVTGTRNEATATRAQLAHAYQDGELAVPEELRRFL